MLQQCDQLLMCHNMWHIGVQTARGAPMDTNAMMGTAAPHASPCVSAQDKDVFV